MPFSTEEFLKIFEQYNVSVWPMQIALNLLALIVIALVVVKNKKADKIINVILAFFWIWMGIVYHWLNFSTINKAAYFFGTVFIIQGLLFMVYGAVKPNIINYKFRRHPVQILGMAFILYALVVYPVLAKSFGHVYPKTPTFGLPCPTTIFTFGILLFSLKRMAWYMVIIPFLWSLIGFSAAISLGIKEDIGLIVAGILGTLILLFVKPKKVITP